MRALLAVLALLAAAPAGYVPIAQQDGVTVSRRHDQQAVEIFAEGVIAAPPERVRAVLLDYPRHPTFMKHIAEIRVLERHPEALLVYQRLDLPVLADRDMNLSVTWGGEGEALWMRFQAVTDRGAPPRSGVVRLAEHHGGWRLQPIQGGKATQAQYRMRINLSGSVPGWMSRGQIGKDVPGLFIAIQRQAQTRERP